VARRLAERAGLDLARVTGSGPGGRITKEDVERALSGVQIAEPAATAVSEPEALRPMAGVRAVIARRMIESHQTTAPVTLNDREPSDHRAGHADHRG